MDKLSSPNKNINPIYTSALSLSPSEKPDMSPYLVHMTGKEAFLSILNFNDTKNRNEGIINCNTPAASKNTSYNEKVACFTESPLFAIEVFSYINQKKSTNWRLALNFPRKI